MKKADSIYSVTAYQSLRMFLLFFAGFLFLQWMLSDGISIWTWPFWIIPLTWSIWATLSLNLLLGIGLLVSRQVTKPETVQGRVEAFRSSRLAFKMIGSLTIAVTLMAATYWLILDVRYGPDSPVTVDFPTVLVAGAVAGLILSILTTTVTWVVIRRERPPFET